jgi:cob(I)alamin adenosyltransferase
MQQHERWSVRSAVQLVCEANSTEDRVLYLDHLSTLLAIAARRSKKTNAVQRAARSVLVPHASHRRRIRWRYRGRADR